MNPEMRAIKPKGHVRGIATIAVISLLCLLGVSLWQRRFDSAEGMAYPSLRIHSSSFADGGVIPRRYTCDGANVSPNLQWAAPPTGTKSFAIVMNDPDAPVEFTHWLAYNIPPDARGLAEGASPQAAMPPGSAEGNNSFGRFGYGGPCPPAGKPHHYVFRLFALNVRIALPPGATRKDVDASIDHHVVAEGHMIGMYQRGGE